VNRKITLVAVLAFMLAAILAMQVVTPAKAEETVPDYPIDQYKAPEGYAKTVWGTRFEVANSSYLNIVMTSSVAVNVSLESVPRLVSFFIEGDGSATATDLTFAGFEPGATYYRHQDGYLIESFTADSSGGYAYTQDISEPHHVYILEYASTLYISTDYTFTSDIYEPIVVAANNIVIDGNGYTLQGSGSGYGFYLWGINGVTIKNVTVKGWTDGIVIFSSSSNTISDSTIASNNNYGIHLGYWSSYNIMANSSIRLNGYIGIEGYRTDYTKVISCNIEQNSINGIQIGWSRWIVQDSTIISNGVYGIYIDSGYYNIIENNNFESNSYGFAMYLHRQWCGSPSPGNNILRNNVFTNNVNGILMSWAGGNILRDNIMTGNNYSLSPWLMNCVPLDTQFQNKNWERKQKSLSNCCKRWIMKESVNRTLFIISILLSRTIVTENPIDVHPYSTLLNFFLALSTILANMRSHGSSLRALDNQLRCEEC